MDDQRADRASGAGVTVALSCILVITGIAMAWPIYNLCYAAMANPGGPMIYLALIPVTLGMWFGGAMVTGAGLFLPFSRPWLGAALGLFTQILVTLAIHFTAPPQ